MRTLALVDGEHYPPVTRAALAVAAERGHEVVAALLVGGTEKLGAGGGLPDLGVPVRLTAADRMVALRRAIAALAPEVGGTCGELTLGRIGWSRYARRSRTWPRR